MVAKTNQEHRHAPLSWSPCRQSFGRVLVAEDHSVNQRLVARMLEKRGDSVVVVDTGNAALEALTYQPFDVVLMDVQMPVMDGFEATSFIRQCKELGSTFPSSL